MRPCKKLLFSSESTNLHLQLGEVGLELSGSRHDSNVFKFVLETYDTVAYATANMEIKESGRVDCGLMHPSRQTEYWKTSDAEKESSKFACCAGLRVANDWWERRSDKTSACDVKIGPTGCAQTGQVHNNIVVLRVGHSSMCCPNVIRIARDTPVFP